MIEVIFRCNQCGHKEGIIQPWDRSVEVECTNCKKLETVGEKTTEKKYSQLIFGGKLKTSPIYFEE